MFMHDQKHSNLTSTHTKTFVSFFSLFPQNICTQCGVNFTFITHVEKCILCLDCYSNTGHLKNNEFCAMLLRRIVDTLNTGLVGLAACLTLCTTMHSIYSLGYVLCFTCYKVDVY